MEKTRAKERKKSLAKTKAKAKAEARAKAKEEKQALASTKAQAKDEIKALTKKHAGALQMAKAAEVQTADAQEQAGKENAGLDEKTQYRGTVIGGLVFFGGILRLAHRGDFTGISGPASVWRIGFCNKIVQCGARATWRQM